MLFTLDEMGIKNRDPVYWRNLASRLDKLNTLKRERDAQWREEDKERREAEFQERVKISGW